ncbi:MAG TPA: 50S ribosomal protein L11 methyltransferase [Verrucomicrobiae bacterium]
MKARRLWQLSVATSSEAEDAIAEVLAGIFGTLASVHFDARKNTTAVSVFLPKLPVNLARKQEELKAAIRRIKEAGLRPGSTRVSLRRLPPENWAVSWKRHFRPIEVGGALLIKPSWSRRKPKRGQAVVVLDPGLSFGTGQHATTGFCLRELVRRRRPGARQSFLDVGTGSGILALAAAKLGFAPVHAFDFDPEAVRVATANARRNRVLPRLQIRRQDVTTLPVKPALQYDLVCANLVSTLLIAERARLAGLVRPDGVLVLAGILRREFAAVQSAYETMGMRLVASRSEREWRSGAFVFYAQGDFD